jgi:hypothetical protein
LGGVWRGKECGRPLPIGLDASRPGGGPTVEIDAILPVTCVLGGRTLAGAEEGVRLNLPGPRNFNEGVSGLTVFNEVIRARGCERLGTGPEGAGSP